MAWSPMISMNGIGSLLALGNKAGHITIWHVGSPEAVRCVKSWKTSSDNWIVRLSWSPWTVEGDYHASILAYASSDGIVQACKIRFNSKTPLESIEASENFMDFPNQTLHPCTVLRWKPISVEVRERRQNRLCPTLQHRTLFLLTSLAFHLEYPRAQHSCV